MSFIQFILPVLQMFLNSRAVWMELTSNTHTTSLRYLNISYSATNYNINMRLFRKFLMICFLLSCPVMSGFAQGPAVKSVTDQFDRLEIVSAGEKIDLKVGESIAIYSDTDAAVDRYDSAFDGAYLNAAYVFYSDGTSNNPNDSKYIRISHVDPKSDINALYALKPTSGYIDMMIYYVIAYWDAKGVTHVAHGEYTFKVRVLPKNGDGAGALKKLSLPKEITIRERYDYLLTPTMEPNNAVASFNWSTTDSGVAFVLAGETALELGQGKYFSENVSLYVTERDCCIRAREAGTATVTVTTDEGLSASVKVNVIPYDIHKADIIDIVDEIYSAVKSSLNR